MNKKTFLTSILVFFIFLVLGVLFFGCKPNAPTPSQYYTVTESNSTGGSVTVKGATNLQSVLAGTSISISAIPDSNHTNATVTINGAVVTLVNNTTAFVVNQNTTISVTFKSLMYQIKVDTTGFGVFGTVSPVNDSIISGKTATINVAPTAGCRVASITANVPFTTNTDSTVITVLNVNSNLNFKIRLTDSLRLTQWQNLQDSIVGNWLFTKVETCYPNNPLTSLQQWVNVPINSCAADDYLQFFKNGLYQYNTNGTFCPGENQNIKVTANWSLSYNGKYITLVYSNGNSPDTLYLNSITANSLVLADFAYQGWNQEEERYSLIRE